MYVASRFITAPGVRRCSYLIGSVLLVTFAAAGCGDDEDGTGPSAECLDQMEAWAAARSLDLDQVQAIHAGDSIAGSLSEADYEGPAGYIEDIYSLDLASDDQVRIGYTPADYQGVLHVLDEEGVYLELELVVNPGDTEVLTADLVAGCYIIRVSAWNGGVTGLYTLTLD